MFLEYSELEETYGDMNLQQLQKNLCFLLKKQGESEGGSICSYIVERIEVLSNKQIKSNSKLTP